MNTPVPALACLLMLGATLAVAQTAPATQPATTQAAEPPPPLVVSDDTRVMRDVLYIEHGDVKLQSLDVYTPRDARDLPIVMFVHGGGWTRGDKDEIGSQPKFFNDNHVIAIGVNYRLSPAVQHPAHADDLAAAVAWVHKNAASFGGDAKKIYLMGHSAGSHTTAAVATDARHLQKVGLDRSAIAGMISLDGSAFDIPDRVANGTANLAENCRRAFGPDESKWADGSPVNHIDAKTPPFLLLYVKPDSLNHKQAQAIAQKIHAVGGSASLVLVPDRVHATLHSKFGTPADPAAQAVLAFVVREGSK